MWCGSPERRAYCDTVSHPLSLFSLLILVLHVPAPRGMMGSNGGWEQMRGIAMAIIAAGLIIGANLQKGDEEVKGYIVWGFSLLTLVVVAGGW